MSEEALDPIIHVQSRLRTMTALSAPAPGDKISFLRLQKLLDMTPGNLSTHLRKLEDVGYVSVEKVIEHRAPITYVILTPRGTAAFAEYVTALRRMLNPERKL